MSLRVAGPVRPAPARGRASRAAEVVLGRVGPVLVAVALLAWLVAAGVRAVETLRTGYDLTYFTQVAWLIGQGETPLADTRDLHLLGDHSYYLLYPVAWLLVPFPTATGLVVVQAAALAAAVWPLALVCRRVARLGPGPTLAVCTAYALMPAVHQVGTADFHPESLAVPWVVAAVLWGAERRWRPTPSRWPSCCCPGRTWRCRSPASARCWRCAPRRVPPGC